MKTVAARRTVDEAIADLSAAAAEFLQQVHAGTVPDARAAAEEHLFALQALLGERELDGALSRDYEYVTTWRAVARLAAASAGPALMHEMEQAG